MKEYTISRSEAGQRFDKYIAKILTQAPMSFCYKMLRKKNITLNGKKADGSEKLTEGDLICFFLADETFEKFSKPEIQSDQPKLDYKKAGLKILYEDKDILAFHKPTGILSQKAVLEDVSVNDYLLTYFAQKGNNDTFKPSVCNRLDRNTSGIILCGLSMKGSQQLSRMLSDRSLHKYYRCIVLGKAKEAHLSGYIRKDAQTNQVTFKQENFPDASPVETWWKPLETIKVLGQDCTVLEVYLITGKTHQIRAHLAALGHPILGDFKYGNKDFNQKLKAKFGFSAQLLHAYRVEFPSKLPELENCQKLTITDPLPEIFETIRNT